MSDQTKGSRERKDKRWGKGKEREKERKRIRKRKKKQREEKRGKGKRETIRTCSSMPEIAFEIVSLSSFGDNSGEEG